ncbi:aldehyde dehydrogenase domain-containing protein [Mycena albidolilacea]|uniref:Aldehyde dehydrogenase domain-containing protein n=1 Tax=Mycena albidolilacea TaxID=1033008 RepID=A0AAD7EJU9_9AGAR|nr:aldehyde dehydrogenase domain-containing protein [Mycena albidolilacea]
MATFTHDFQTGSFTGKTSFPTGLFIDGEFREGSEKTTIDIVNPTTGRILTTIPEATKADLDIAVKAAQKAFDTTWGLNVGGAQRGELLNKLARLMEEHQDELSAIEAVDNGKTFSWAKNVDVAFATATIKYYAGWADKISGQTLETDEKKLIYTRHEPIGVVGQIIPWNFPLLMFSWKVGPALATGNTIVLKPSEFTPLTALRMCSLIKEAGFPPGVVNVLTGYGHTVGQAIAEHQDIQKVAFTGSTLVGRKVMAAAAASNLKNVTLELGGKSPNIVFDDADLDQAVSWAAHGIFWNHGQACCAGSRVYVQAGIYDEFLRRFTEQTKKIKVGDPFAPGVDQGPQVSQQQYDRIMGYIESGKKDGATVHTGGNRHGTEGFFIEPTIFTDTTENMQIVKEEIFGPVGVIIKFTDEADVLRQANDTVFGLAAAVFSQDINRALQTAHKLQAGTAWVNCVNQLHANVPFGGYKQSGIGRELGEYALHNYTNVKAVHVNLGHRM